MSTMAKLISYDVRGVSPEPPKGAEVIQLPPPEPELPEVELPDGMDRYRLYSDDALGQFKPVQWLISGYLARKELTVLYGQPGTYKSFVAQGWAMDLAAAGHTAIYISAEGASGLRMRTEAWKKHHGFERFAGNFLTMPNSINLHDSDAVKQWSEAITLQLKEWGIPEDELTLIGVDTLNRNFVGEEENSPKEMGMFVEGCDRIMRAFNTAMLVVHHMGVSTGRERGTAALRGGTFAMFQVTKPGGGLVARLECTRMKDAEESPATTHRLHRVELPDLEPTTPGLDSLALDRSFTVEQPDEPPERWTDFDAAVQAVLGLEDKTLSGTRILKLVRKRGVKFNQK